MKKLDMEKCQGACGLVLPISQLYTCDCPRREVMCIHDLKKHADQLHTNYYHVPGMVKKK